MKGLATLRRRPDLWGRGVLVVSGLVLLVFIYLFQRTTLPIPFADFSPNITFIVNRTSRLIANDLACLLIILGVFRERKYLKLAFLVLIVELLVLLPTYFAIKLALEGASEISSPLLSQIHRLIVNPTLMLLLIFGFFYQRFLSK